MSASNLLVAVSLLQELLRQAVNIGTLLHQAHAEGRTLTAVELQAIRDARNAAIAGLDAAIAEAESQAS